MKKDPIIFDITVELARKIIREQFPEFTHLPIQSVEKQGHDNRTYRLGETMLMRIPTEACYALKVSKEQELLPQLAPHLPFNIPSPIKMGHPSKMFPFPFSIYKWLEGTSLNLLTLPEEDLEKLAVDLAKFLKALQAIKNVEGPEPGPHNFWRGAHVSVYEQETRQYTSVLSDIIDTDQAIKLWENACETKWKKSPIWIHGDFATGNILVKEGKLSAIIDFGGTGVGDPACDLVMAWTFFKGNARKVFIKEMNLDQDTWLRAKAWALWKAMFQLYHLKDKNTTEAFKEKKIIEDILDEYSF
jgi:aminoglycoside phosphotransferase (APT) family kinase protein